MLCHFDGKRASARVFIFADNLLKLTQLEKNSANWLLHSLEESTMNPIRNLGGAFQYLSYRGEVQIAISPSVT